MRVTTLKASADGLGGLLAYYAGLAEDRARPGPGRGPVDYYLDPDEPAGRWWGAGRGALGLKGEVTGGELRSLLEGHHPVTGRRLGRSFGDASARAFDATFSAPKSVSVLWALTPDPWVRAEVLAAHDSAVDAALGWFETHGAVTRRGTDGILQVDTAGVTVAVFRQHTSRTMDPQLHSHAVISAKVQDPTGRWLSLDARFLKYQQRTIGWIYDAALRAELTDRLGVTWEQTVDGPADMTCIPAEAREVFSQRSVQVEAKLHDLIQRWSADHGGAEPDSKTIAQLGHRAALISRPAKGHGIDPSTLHATWSADAVLAGFDPSRLVPSRLGSLSVERPASDAELVGEALRRVAEESSTWLRADIARHLTKQLPVGDGCTAADLVARIDRLAAEAEQRCVPIGPERPDTVRCRRDGRLVLEHVTDRHFTTASILDQELDLHDWAAAHAHVPPAIGEAHNNAVNAMAGTSQLELIVGPAGTGKTTTVAYAVQRLHAHGRHVVGLAPSGKGADVLAAEAGCRSLTLASLLTRHSDGGPSRLPAGATVILDEAGMAATEDLAGLVDLARRHRWRLVLVGDPAQLPAVGRGGVFAHWCDTLPHHELTTPRRFDHEWEAAASLALRAGHPDAVDTYASHHRVHAAHPALMAQGIARVHARDVSAGRTVAITTNTAEMARAINREIQRHNHPAGRAMSVIELADGTNIGPGDQIATRRNHPQLFTDRGEPVRNRHTWTVTAVHPDGTLTVSHPERGTVTLPSEYRARHVELGWAVTGYGNQGDTVDIGLAVLEPGTTRNHAYVAMTRGRQRNDAWLPDPTGTLDPAEALADIVARTPQHASALATRDRLHRQAGLEPPSETLGPDNDLRHDLQHDLQHDIARAQARLDALQRQSPGRSLEL